MHYSMVKQPFSIFRVITANFSGVRIFRSFMVSNTVHPQYLLFRSDVSKRLFFLYTLSYLDSWRNCGSENNIITTARKICDVILAAWENKRRWQVISVGNFYRQGCVVVQLFRCNRCRILKCKSKHTSGDKKICYFSYNFWSEYLIPFEVFSQQFVFYRNYTCKLSLHYSWW